MNVFFTLVRGTLSGLLRERILYNVVFISLFLIFMGYLASLLVYGHQDRVMLHFGMMVISLTTFFIAASSGSKVIRQEVESRTLYLTLSKPVSRPLYYFSKWVGIGAFLLMNLTLLTVVLVIGLHYAGGDPNYILLQAMMLVWVEAMIIAALTLLLSLLTTPALTVMIAFTYILIAHNQEQVQYLKEHGAGVASWLSTIPQPKAHLFLLDTRVYYEQALSSGECVYRMIYGLIWGLFFMFIGNALFYRKNL